MKNDDGAIGEGVERHRLNLVALDSSPFCHGYVYLSSCGELITWAALSLMQLKHILIKKDKG